MAPPVERVAIGLLLISLSAVAAESSPPPDMNLIEFLGSVDVNTKNASGTEILTAIDTGLLTRHDYSCTETGPDVAAERP
jgi:hypothetical protein